MVEISGLTWAVTVGVVVALYALDLVLAMLRPHRVGPPEARAWSAFYIAVAVAFGAWLFIAHGFLYGIEYLVGYIVEKGLSTDNVFVFLIIMATFAAPEEHQHTVLTLGIMLALFMRAIFIALGAALISLFSFAFLIFGLLLIYTPSDPSCATARSSRQTITWPGTSAWRVAAQINLTQGHWLRASRRVFEFQAGGP